MSAAFRTADRALRRFFSGLFSDRRGSTDLNTYLLLTAAGACMVGLVAPSMFNSSKKCSNTFDKQVDVLERGASPGGGGGMGGGLGGGLGGGFGGGSLSGLMGGLGGGGSLTSGGGGSMTNGGGSITSGSNAIVTGSGGGGQGQSQGQDQGNGNDRNRAAVVVQDYRVNRR